MTETLFQIVFEELELEVSSFSYRSSADGASGQCVVKGVDDLTFISDNLETGTLSLLINSTEILTCTLDTDVRPTLGTVSDSIVLTFGDDIAFSQSIATTFDIDDSSSTSGMNGGYWTFRLPEIDPGYQSGMLVNYTSVSRYILSVAVSWSGSGGGSVTLTEGAEPPDDESVAGDPGDPGCTYQIALGVELTGQFSSDCSSGRDSLDTYISPEGYTYDMFVFTCRQFTLSAEAAIDIEWYSVALGLDTTGIAFGMEFDLIQGVYTPFTNPAPTIYTFRAGFGSFSGTLPAGIYTVRMTVYIDRDLAYDWEDMLYTLLVDYA